MSSSESSSESSESDDGDVASDKLHQLISKQVHVVFLVIYFDKCFCPFAIPMKIFNSSL